MVRGELKKLSSLFDKYKERLVAPEASVVNAFLEVVTDMWGVDLKRESVRYNPSSKTLSFVGKGPLHTEIRLREKEILDHLRGRLGEKGAPKKII